MPCFGQGHTNICICRIRMCKCMRVLARNWKGLVQNSRTRTSSISRIKRTFSFIGCINKASFDKHNIVELELSAQQILISIMPSLRTGEYQAHALAAPLEPGMTKSRPQTVSKNTGWTHGAEAAMSLKLSPSLLSVLSCNAARKPLWILYTTPEIIAMGHNGTPVKLQRALRLKRATVSWHFGEQEAQSALIISFQNDVP